MTDNQINQLKGLKELLDSGVLSQEEFEKEKSRIIGNADGSSSEPIINNDDEEKQIPSKNVMIIGGLTILLALVFVAVYFVFFQRNTINHSESTSVDSIDTVIKSNDVKDSLDSMYDPNDAEFLRNHVKGEKDAKAFVAHQKGNAIFLDYLYNSYQGKVSENRVYYIIDHTLFKYDFIEGQKENLTKALKEFDASQIIDAKLSDNGFIMILSKRKTGDFIIVEYKTYIDSCIPILSAKNAKFINNKSLHVDKPKFLQEYDEFQNEYIGESFDLELQSIQI